LRAEEIGKAVVAGATLDDGRGAPMIAMANDLLSRCVSRVWDMFTQT
jgi:hypothetical protein